MQKILPVIHCQTIEQSIINAEIAISHKADGVFLINHSGISIPDMIKAFLHIKDLHNDFFVGLNILGINGVEAFKIAKHYNFDGLWLDESYVRGNIHPEDIGKLNKSLKELDEALRDYKGLYFGSVAFKTQPFCPDPHDAAINAIPHMDVITTSGEATANPPSIEKIASMKNAIGNNKLAIASGITPENIVFYNMADYILVASGISKSWTEIDENKLSLLINNSKK